MTTRALVVLGVLGAIGVVAGCATTRRPAAQTGFLFGQVDGLGPTLRYAIYVPRDYTPAKPWPLILFLHGQGESGTDGARPIIQGLGSAMLWDIGKWPAIVLFPQKPTEDAQWEQHEAGVMELVARARRAYNVDGSRVYLTGLSQGGHGAWVLGARHPDLWAAVVPVCGYAGADRGAEAGLPEPFHGSAAELAAALRNTPVWAFHGAIDDVVPPSETVAMGEALRAAGATPRISILAGVNHGAWDPAYRDPALPEWLFAQRRTGSGDAR